MDDEQTLKAELERTLAECKRLREENVHLRMRLGEIAPDAGPPAQTSLPGATEATHASTAVTAESPAELKVSMFMNLFRGRDDVYAVRWEGRAGRTGYFPAGNREWNQPSAKVPGKKRTLRHRQLFPLTKEVIRDHLLGRQTIGVYPLMHDDTCWFVAVDFDKKTWQADAAAFLATCCEVGVPAALERSRSGNGGHICEVPPILWTENSHSLSDKSRLIVRATLSSKPTS